MRHFKSAQKVFVGLVFVLFLAGCVVVPKTPEQSLAVTDSGFSSTVFVASDMIQSGLIQGDTADEVYHYVHKGNDALDAAWSLHDAGKSYETKQDIVKSANQALLKIIREKRQEANNE